DGRAVAELSLDTVEMQTGGRASMTHELETELRPSGTLNDLHGIAAALKPYKLKAQSKSKFERALAKLGHARAGSAGKRKKAPGARSDAAPAAAGPQILRVHPQRQW